MISYGYDHHTTLLNLTFTLLIWLQLKVDEAKEMVTSQWKDLEEEEAEEEAFEDSDQEGMSDSDEDDRSSTSD